MIPADLEDALRERYGDRPDTLAEVLADAEAWEELKAAAQLPAENHPCETTRGEP